MDQAFLSQSRILSFHALKKSAKTKNDKKFKLSVAVTVIRHFPPRKGHKLSLYSPRTLYRI